VELLNSTPLSRAEARAALKESQMDMDRALTALLNLHT